MAPGREPSRADDAGSDRDGDPLLAVDDLRTHVHTDRGTTRAVDGVDFEIDRGETVCLVGESGSGKTVTCESITGIVPQPPAEIVGGSITFDGTDLTELAESDLERVRGDRVGHVFQNPQTALDPVYTVGEQIAEAIEIHRDVSRANARDRAIDLLRRVGIPSPSVRVDDYPHEFSGGMRQRVAIAIALAADPDLVIADEPTTAVDVTVQARLLDLLRSLTAGGTSLLLVTHDLRVTAALADRVLVMFGGTIVERGPTGAVFANPAHPYTQALFESFRGRVASANVDRDGGTARGDIPGDGCRFRGQCPHAIDACAGGDQPPFYDLEVGPDHAGEAAGAHQASCVYYAEERESAPVREGVASLTPDDSEGAEVDDDD